MGHLNCLSLRFLLNDCMITWPVCLSFTAVATREWSPFLVNHHSVGAVLKFQYFSSFTINQHTTQSTMITCDATEVMYVCCFKFFSETAFVIHALHDSFACCQYSSTKPVLAASIWIQSFICLMGNIFSTDVHLLFIASSLQNQTLLGTCVLHSHHLVSVPL